MDLNTITEIVCARDRRELVLDADTAVIAGGTWMFSEPQTHLRRLIDLTSLDWPAITVDEAGLTLAATCTVEQVAALSARTDWAAAALFRQCADALLASVKVWRFATVGGNLCLAFPAGAMISLTAALDARCVIWTPAGGERRQAVVEFVTGNCMSALAPGEVLRAIEIPAAALHSRTAFRKIALSPLGRSGAVIIGVRSAARPAPFVLLVSAATVRPIRIAFSVPPSAADLAQAVNRIPGDLWLDDAHGTPDWRRQVTLTLGEEIRVELAPEPA